jgi:hypothetical protein
MIGLDSHCGISAIPTTTKEIAPTIKLASLSIAFTGGVLYHRIPTELAHMSASLPLPTAEQQQRAKWDLLLLDLEFRTEQVRQLKRFEPWKLAATMASAIAIAGSALAALALWASHLV